MRVALLSTNDIAGGAAIVTLRLTHALRRAGVEATMVARAAVAMTLRWRRPAPGRVSPWRRMPSV